MSIEPNRLTPEREKEIRNCSDYWDLFSGELLAEIDALRAEFETAAMKCNDYQMKAIKLEKERDLARKQLGDAHLEMGQFREERDEFERLAKSWMSDYSKLKEKYEPLELILASPPVVDDRTAALRKENQKLKSRIEKLRECLRSLLASEALKEAPFYGYSEAISDAKVLLVQDDEDVKK